MKYILIYVYNSLSDDELSYWEDLAEKFKEIGYELFFLFQLRPNREVKVKYDTFIERLDDVQFPISTKAKTDNQKLNTYLDREQIWYGQSSYDRVSAINYQIRKYTLLLKELNPSLIILGNGQHTGELIMRDLASDAKIPLIFIERGSLPFTWHIDSLGMTAGTEIAKKKLSEIKLPISTTIFDTYTKYYLKERETWWSQPAKSNDSDIRKRYNIDNKTQLILFANQLDNDTSNFLYNPLFKNNVEAFEWLCQSVNELKLDCFVLAKKHPHFKGDENDFKKAIQNHRIKGAWIDDIPLFDCLEQSNLVCAVNSTLLFEALIYEKPVLQFGDSILNNKEIVYKLSSDNDLESLESWFNRFEFKIKINNFKSFMSFLIENEFTFFFNGADEMGFNTTEFFVNRVLPYCNDNLGQYPNKYIKVNNFNPKNTLKSKLKKKIKSIFN